jgi:hypothetical protein
MPNRLRVSKQRVRQADAMACVRLKREQAVQTLGFTSRPFVLCGLQVKRPSAGELLHERRNGQFVLQVTGHPSYGLPWGQDRLVPIFPATLAIRQQTPRLTFDSAAGMLDSFGLQQCGSQYRRLVALSSVYSARLSSSVLRHNANEPLLCTAPLQLHERSPNLVFQRPRPDSAARGLSKLGSRQSSFL